MISLPHVGVIRIRRIVASCFSVERTNCNHHICKILYLKKLLICNLKNLEVSIGNYLGLDVNSMVVWNTFVGKLVFLQLSVVVDLK